MKVLFIDNDQNEMDMLRDALSTDSKKRFEVINSDAATIHGSNGYLSWEDHHNTIVNMIKERINEFDILLLDLILRTDTEANYLNTANISELLSVKIFRELSAELIKKGKKMVLVSSASFGFESYKKINDAGYTILNKRFDSELELENCPFIGRDFWCRNLLQNCTQQNCFIECLYSEVTK